MTLQYTQMRSVTNLFKEIACVYVLDAGKMPDTISLSTLLCTEPLLVHFREKKHKKQKTTIIFYVNEFVVDCIIVCSNISSKYMKHISIPRIFVYF